MKEISKTIKPVIAEAYCKGITEEEFIDNDEKKFIWHLMKGEKNGVPNKR